MLTQLFAFLNQRWPECWSLALTVVTICLLSATPQPMAAQGFNSGSTGVDGALTYSCAQACTITFDPQQLPNGNEPAGTCVYNFTTIDIPSTVTLRLSNQNLNCNAGVYWLAQGNVTIAGIIDLSGSDGSDSAQVRSSLSQSPAGAGGYIGGLGGQPGTPALPGNGPSGGAAGDATDIRGKGGIYGGNQFLVPMMGGSGGGGGLSLVSSWYGGAGGSGGGAIVIATNTTMVVSGTIKANGGNAGGNRPGACEGVAGGASGGGIRLLANSIGGGGTLNVDAGRVLTGCGGFGGSAGQIRFEAYAITFNGILSGPVSQGNPYNVFLPSQMPSVNVISVNGVQVNIPATGSLQTPDVTITTTNPVPIVIQATGIPVGTIVTLQVLSDNGPVQTITFPQLTDAGNGTTTTTATATFPPGYSLSFVKATW